MAIQRQLRDTEGIGSLKLVSALDLPITGEADSVDELIDRLVGGVRASLNNPSRLHGLRAEAMFRAVLVALGDFQLLVEEDEGQLYYDDAEGPVKLPDYRIVGSDGRELLVEVKAVPPKPRRVRHRIPAVEVHGLLRYGRLTAPRWRWPTIGRRRTCGRSLTLTVWSYATGGTSSSSPKR